MLSSVVGLSTARAAVCGAPVLPVVGLAFAGLSSGTLAFLSSPSRVTTLVVLLALAVAILTLAWQAGEAWGAVTGARTPAPRTIP
jgi:hypothetical protein